MLKTAGPIAVGAGLIAVFIFLLLRNADESRPVAPAPPVAAGPPVAAAPTSSWDIPLGSPTERVQITPPPPAKPGLDRWTLDDVPTGWNPQVAEHLAGFFARMEVTADKSAEQLIDLAKAREEIAEYLKNLGPEAIPTLSKILRVETDFVNRRFILYGLGNLGPRSEDATIALLDFYNARKDLEGSRSEVNHVIDAMKYLKNDSAYQMMGSFVDDKTTSSEDCDKFVQALGEHPRREEAEGRFIEKLRGHPDRSVRNHAAQALGKVKNKNSLGDLMAQCDREEAWNVRQTILGTIGKIGDPSAFPFLERVARTDEDSRVRLSAASAIRRIGTPRAKRILASVQAEERDPKNRDRFQGWLEEM